MAVLPLSDYARGLAEGTEFIVEDLEQNTKHTYVVWRGEAYKKSADPAMTVTDFHDQMDIKNFNFGDDKQLAIYNDQVWVRTWTHNQGYTWVLWEP